MDGLMKYMSKIYRCSNLWRTNQLEEEGLTGIQHIYIFHICKEPGISQEKLATHISVNKSNVARQLASLENEGMIERRVSSSDKRVYEVYPTQKALELYPKVRSLMGQWNHLLMEELDDQEKEILQQCLAKMVKKARTLTEGE